MRSFSTVAVSAWSRWVGGGKDIARKAPLTVGLFAQQEENLVRYMRDLEEYLYINRLQTKYFALLKKGAFVLIKDVQVRGVELIL